jgi:gluconolactonase
VYCLEPTGNLHEVLNNVPSPNGLVFDTSGRFLFVSATRANNIWRVPIFEDYSTGKVGAFQTFFGTSGPDGLALDQEDNLYVAHASLGGVFQLNRRGELLAYIKAPIGHTVTNICFMPSLSSIIITESSTGTILKAKIMNRVE